MPVPLPLNAHSKICFLHIPKTAGTSVIEMMRQEIAPEQFYYAHGQCISPRSRFLQIPQILIGHFFLRDFSPRFFSDTYVFTFLRHPVDRVISQYYFFRQLPRRSHDPEVVLAKSYPLRDILLGVGDNARWNNVQTTWLSGETASKIADRQSLRRAIHNLRLLDFVGVYEQLQASWSRLAANLGLANGKLPMCNRTAERPALNELDPELVKLIEEKNAWDLELYAEACSLFGSNRVPPRHRHELLQIDEIPKEIGTRDVFFEEINFVAEGARGLPIQHGDTIRIRLTLGSHIDCPDLTVGFAIRDHWGVQIYGTNTWLKGHRIAIRKGQSLSVDLTIKARLDDGTYSFVAATHPGADSSNICFHWIERALEFRVIGSSRAQFDGLVDLEAEFDRCDSTRLQIFGDVELCATRFAA